MTHLAYLSEVCVCVCVCEFYGDPKVDHRLLLIVPGMHVISVTRMHASAKSTRRSQKIIAVRSRNFQNSPC